MCILRRVIIGTGLAIVRLAEDASLAGFTPLMYMEPAVAWTHDDPAVPPHAAEHALRTRKLLFFGTELVNINNLIVLYLLRFSLLFLMNKNGC